MQEYADQLEELGLWERREGEPDMWYSRFEEYRLAGSSRSIRQVYLADCERRNETPKNTAPGSWYEAARQWNWNGRAGAWDEQQRHERRRAEEATRVEMRTKRRAKYDERMADLDDAITTAKEKTKFDELRLLTDTYLKLLAEIRKEYNDEPAQRVEIADPDERINVILPGLNDA